MVMIALRIVLVLVSGLVLLGCTTQPVREQPAESVREVLELDFIESGSTTRAQIIDELGEPFLRFDEERIYAYYLTRERRTSGSAQATWSTEATGLGGALGREVCMRLQPHMCASEHQLILVFDGHGVLTRYSYLRGAAER